MNDFELKYQSTYLENRIVCNIYVRLNLWHANFKKHLISRIFYIWWIVTKRYIIELNQKVSGLQILKKIHMKNNLCDLYERIQTYILNKDRTKGLYHFGWRILTSRIEKWSCFKETLIVCNIRTLKIPN